jgi:hypothetical protein
MAYNCRIKDQSGKSLKEFYGKTLDSMRTVENRARKWQRENLLEGETQIENF